MKGGENMKELKNKLVGFCKDRKRVLKMSVVMCLSMLSCITAFADTTNTLTTDASTVTSMATSVMGLFSTYPLNIILAMGLLGGVIAVVRKLKRSAS